MLIASFLTVLSVNQKAKPYHVHHQPRESWGAVDGGWGMCRCRRRRYRYLIYGERVVSVVIRICESVPIPGYG